MRAPGLGDRVEEAVDVCEEERRGGGRVGFGDLKVGYVCEL